MFYKLKKTPSFEWPNLKDKKLLPSDLADYFLTINNYWFIDPKNSLYKKRNMCFEALLNFMADDCPNVAGAIYIIDKFNKEFFKDFYKME